MDKVLISNRINRLGCGQELLYCSRVYVQARLYPTGWAEMERLLNITFYLITGEKNHVRAAWLWERRYHVTKKKKRKEETPSG